MWEWDLAGSSPGALAQVRRWAEAALDDLGEDHRVDAILVAVELVTNAYDHGTALVSVLRAAIESLSTDDRSLLDAVFNLSRAHSAATLTDRRHSLAAARNVSFRTTRAADKALHTLVIALIATHQERHSAVNEELAAADANHRDE